MKLPREIEVGLEWLVRLGLGALFIVAGLVKLHDPGKFAVEIADYRLVPVLAPYLAVMLPPIEVVLGVTLVFGSRDWRKAAALSMGLLLVVFTVAVSQVVLRGINVECGCFGGSSGTVTPLTIVRDIVLLVATQFAFKTARRDDEATA
jgi:uncharacterized membrane protein YphA (DoxX/SURF4 family)